MQNKDPVEMSGSGEVTLTLFANFDCTLLDIRSIGAQTGSRFF